MCGIFSFWAKESTLTRNQYHTLFMGASERGRDGVGVCIFNPTDRSVHVYKTVDSYIRDSQKILDFVERGMTLGCILLANCRATPETEGETDIEHLQPIVVPLTQRRQDDFILIHNGGITDSIKNALSYMYHYETPIDSEAIIASYLKYNRNMTQALEYLSGSWAFVMIDVAKKMIYAGCSFNPLAHMYVRGVGYFYHSSNDCLADVLCSLTNTCQDGLNVWESWYHHYIEGYTYINTDLDSGFQFKHKYKPRFLHPTWDSRNKGTKTKALVAASGGIDSGLTAYTLKKAGYDVEMVHFKYGQKAEEAELWAITNLCRRIGISKKVLDISNLFNDPSMLLDKDIEVTSGGDDLKSTIAWVSGRNAIFSSILMGMAETEILKHNYKKVYISAGWAQLSEETGGYPDNSFKFNEAINEIKNYGYITGARIEFLPVMQNITKTEEWVLGDRLGFPFEYTVSCDDPEMEIFDNGAIANALLCTECGSTKLSILASDRAGVIDPRQFKGVRPRLSAPMNTDCFESIVNRLVLPTRRDNDLIIQRRVR